MTESNDDKIDKRTLRGPKYDRELLISKIAMMRIKSKSTYEVLEMLQEKFGMGRATAYLILKEAQEHIREMGQNDLDTAYEEAIQQIEQKMSNVGDRQWLEYRKELNKLKGLYRPIKVEHSGKIEHNITGLDITYNYTGIQPPQTIEVKNLNDETKD